MMQAAAFPTTAGNQADHNEENPNFCFPSSRMWKPPGLAKQNIHRDDAIQKYWRDLPSVEVPWEFVKLFLLIVMIVLLIVSVAIPRAKFLDQMSVDGWRWLVLAIAMLGGPFMSKLLMKFLVFVTKKCKYSGTRSIYCLKVLKSPIGWMVWVTVVILLSWAFLVPSFSDTTMSEALNEYVWRWLNLTAESISARRLGNFVDIVCHSKFIQLDETSERSVWGPDLPPGQTRCHKKALLVVEDIFRELFPGIDNPIDSCITNVVLNGRIPAELLDETKKFILLGSKKNEITGRDIQAWVIRVFWERRALELSLSDVHVALECLNSLANYVLGISVIMACIFTLVRDSTIVIAAIVFIISQSTTVTTNFGESMNHVFKALMFVFITRQFDVGDIIRKDNTRLMVESMNLLTTECYTADNEKASIFNSILLLHQDIYRREEEDAECSLAF